MKKIKNLLIVFSIIILLLCIIIIIIKLNNKENNINANTLDSNQTITNEYLEGESRQGIVGETKEESIINESDYITLVECIDNFLNKINRNSSVYFGREGQRTSTDEEINNGILKLLSEDYINKNNITTNNIKNYIYNINKSSMFIPRKIIKYYESEQVNSFVINGLVEDKDYNPIMEISLILNIDTKNVTYSIEILNTKQNLNTIKPKQIKEIEIKSSNEFTYMQLTDENIIQTIRDVYIGTVIGYPEIFYNNYLAEDYKKAKFSNVAEFKDYISKNTNRIKETAILKCNKTENEQETTYILEDKYGNNYILKYNSINKYKMYLDSYTVDLDVFKENYEKASDEEKVSLNVGKFKQMLNTKDYNTIYNKLNETFRKNNFSTVSKLEEYLKKNTYEINSIKVENKNQQNDYYVCECTLVDQTNTEQTKKMTIMIKLLDNNNFSMSFSIK